MFCEDCTRLQVILLDDASQSEIDPYWIEVECLDCESRWTQSWPEKE